MLQGSRFDYLNPQPQRNPSYYRALEIPPQPIVCRDPRCCRAPETFVLTQILQRTTLLQGSRDSISTHSLQGPQVVIELQRLATQRTASKDPKML